MTLTTIQIEAVKQGETIRVAVPEIGAECVVLRADVYERVRAILDDGLSMDQVGALVAGAMREDDEDDPLLESYQHYRQ
jgi:hypothetical protein